MIIRIHVWQEGVSWYTDVFEWFSGYSTREAALDGAKAWSLQKLSDQRPVPDQITFVVIDGPPVQP